MALDPNSLRFGFVSFRFSVCLRLLHGFMPQLKYFNGITYEASGERLPRVSMKNG